MNVSQKHDVEERNFTTYLKWNTRNVLSKWILHENVSMDISMVIEIGDNKILFTLMAFQIARNSRMILEFRMTMP